MIFSFVYQTADISTLSRSLDSADIYNNSFLYGSAKFTLALILTSGDRFTVSQKKQANKTLTKNFFEQ